MIKSLEPSVTHLFVATMQNLKASELLIVNELKSYLL